MSATQASSVSEALVKLGRAWLENAPPAQADLSPSLAGWIGPVGFVCKACASRILGRGCDLKKLADVPAWDSAPSACALCGQLAQEKHARLP